MTVKNKNQLKAALKDLYKAQNEFDKKYPLSSYNGALYCALCDAIKKLENILAENGEKAVGLYTVTA